jgi:hypothetical protein
VHQRDVVVARFLFDMSEKAIDLDSGPLAFTRTDKPQGSETVAVAAT